MSCECNEGVSVKGTKNVFIKFILCELVYVPLDTVHEFHYPVVTEEVDDVGLASTIVPLSIGR